jgi:protein BCP1
MESDPLAFLTVLNLHVHKVKLSLYLGKFIDRLVEDHPSIRALVQYLFQKISPDAAFTSTLQSLLRNEISHVGLVIGERVYNMPPQVIPPMYRMLRDEISWAVEEASKLSVSLEYTTSCSWLSPERTVRIHSLPRPLTDMALDGGRGTSCDGRYTAYRPTRKETKR